MIDIPESVQQIIVEHFKARELHPPHIVPEARLAEDLGVDSIDLAEIVFALEDHFGLEIEETKVEKVRTVGDIIALIAAPEPITPRPEGAGRS